MVFKKRIFYRQQIILWASKNQLEAIKFSEWLHIGLVYNGIPKWFEFMMVIMWKDEIMNKTLPWAFALATSASNMFVYKYVFKHLKFNFKVIAKQIVFPLNFMLYKSLKDIFIGAKLVAMIQKYHS